MLGHRLYRLYRDRFETWGTVRGGARQWEELGLFDQRRLLGGVEATNLDTVLRAVAMSKPDAVINCIGVVKQSAAAKDPLPSIAINSLFPHRLAALCQAAGARLIHVSTDCVFSGRKGNYSEEDVSDAEDLYGRTKCLGEVQGENFLTIRTSLIGREIAGGPSLIEWFVGQRGGTVKGYKGAVFSGFTTEVLGEIIADILEKHVHLNGLWHLSSAAMNKFDLLTLVNEAFGLGITIQADKSFVCDRSLDSLRFRTETGYRPPAWETMISRLAADRAPYYRA